MVRWREWGLLMVNGQLSSQYKQPALGRGDRSTKVTPFVIVHTKRCYTGQRAYNQIA
jgi:hypothetical protein